MSHYETSNIKNIYLKVTNFENKVRLNMAMIFRGIMLKIATVLTLTIAFQLVSFKVFGQPCIPLSGDKEWTISSAGGTRRFLVHVPPSNSSGSLRPLVFNFHGALGNAELGRANTRLDAVANSKGFIVVYPNGYKTTWNGGACCGGAVGDNINDVQFVRDMLDKVLIPQYCVDARRVYATGFSNGGYLSHRLACELSDRIAAISAVGGVNGMPTCKPSRPISILQTHGTADSIINYNLAPPTIQAWVARNGCTGSSRETFRNGNAHCDTWSTCQGGSSVQLCTVDGMGHRWPGSTQSEGLGSSSSDIDISNFGIDFLLKYSLPSPATKTRPRAPANLKIL